MMKIIDTTDYATLYIRLPEYNWYQLRFDWHRMLYGSVYTMSSDEDDAVRVWL
jgi:hypothetical protein